MNLFPYQEIGVEFLAGHTRALLADTMGLGKTAMAIVAAERVRRPGSDMQILVVCPASIALNWHREFEMWWLEGDDFDGDTYSHECDVAVVSYDKLVRNLHLYLRSWDVVILDEAHFLKNPKAKRTQAVFGKRMDGVGGVIEKARYVWCLTGTPAPNNASELWPMLHALNPGAIFGHGKNGYSPRNFWSFTRRYCVVKNNGFGEVIVRGQRLEELREKMAPFMLRRLKQEVLPDLPEIRFGELPLEATAAAETMGAPLTLNDNTQRIKEALCIGVEALAKLSAEMATLRRYTAMAKAGAVAEWVKLWLETCNDKIVIFAIHREALAALEKAFTEHNPAVVHGGVTQGLRQAAVDQFQSDQSCRVFLGQIQAAGTGITLTAASDLIFLEQSWTPSENAQAAMRIHRIGQKRGCLIRVAMLAGSIDEAVQRVLARKTEDLVALFDAVA